MRNCLTRYIIILFVFVTTGLRKTTGIKCYQCGTEAIFVDGPIPIDEQKMEAIIRQESCQSFERAFTWSAFAISCEESQVCAKTITIWSGSEGKTTIRGCASRNNSIGQVHQLGCGEMQSSRMGPSDSELSIGDEICMCETDYCNSANLNQLFLTKIGLIFTIVLLLLSI